MTKKQNKGRTMKFFYFLPLYSLKIENVQPWLSRGRSRPYKAKQIHNDKEETHGNRRSLRPCHQPIANRQLQSMEDSLNPSANVVGRYSDVGFGRNSQRPGLQEALERLQEGDVDSLVVQSLDRLGRSARDVALLASMFRIIEIPDYGFTWHLESVGEVYPPCGG